MGIFYFGSHMNFWTLFVGNVLFSFALSYLLVRFGNQHKKNYSYFTDAPSFKFLEKISLNSTYKFEIEYGLSFFLIPASLVMLACLSYVLTLPLPGIDQGEFFFMCILGEAMLLLMAALMNKTTFETFFQDKELRDVQAHDLYVTEPGFYFPISPLEGVWREIARKAHKPHLLLKYDSIAEITVEPAREIYRPKPPYYRITLKDNPLKVHFQRRQFYGVEKKFLDLAASKGIPITYNDKLRD